MADRRRGMVGSDRNMSEVEHRALKSIDDLKPANYNPRTITKSAAAALSKSLGDFGDLSGIVFNTRTMNLVTAHQRVAQLRSLGAVLDGEWLVLPSTGERFHVRLVDWPLIKEKAANVIANSQEIAGEFTDEVDGLIDEITDGIGAENAADLLLDELRTAGDEAPAATELKEWDASKLSLDAMFIFSAPIELQPKIRSVIEREFPGVNFREEVVYG